MKIRHMKPSDLPQVVPLAAQLGYPTTLPQLEERFNLLSVDETSALFVAESDENQIVAFAHAQESVTLMTGRRAELHALVVNQSVRGKGIGKEIIRAVEGWGQSRGLNTLRLGSRTSRTDTHEFYKKIGFSVEKTWFVFSKRIENTTTSSPFKSLPESPAN